MTSFKIKVGIIGGTGLDDPANQILESCTILKREDIKTSFGIPSSDLYEGKISGVDVVLLSRHCPGHKIVPTLVNYRANIEALRILGCTHILASTACGSLHKDYERGSLVVPNSFIDRTVHRKNSFFDGTSSQYSGVCHIPMEPAFDKRTSEILCLAAEMMDIPIKKCATIVTIEGPRFSSRAESLMFQSWGGHLINMTTCPEVCLAKEAGLLYASVAMVTDYDCWKSDDDIVNAMDCVALFKKNINKITKILVKAVELIGSQKNWNQDINDLRNLIVTSNVSK